MPSGRSLPPARAPGRPRSRATERRLPRAVRSTQPASLHRVIQRFLGNAELRDGAVAHEADFLVADRACVISVGNHAAAEGEEFDSGIELRGSILAPSYEVEHGGLLFRRGVDEGFSVVTMLHLFI